MNLALENSLKNSIEDLKKNSTLEYVINLLQIETWRRYNQIMELPSKLEILRDRLDLILKVQKTIIELMRRRYLQLLEKELLEMVPPILSRLSTALRYLMRSELKVNKARDELVIASEIINDFKEKFAVGNKVFEEMKSLSQKIEGLISIAK
jgi:hypothetical protein